MTQDTHTFVHSPQGLKMIKRQPVDPKRQRRHNQQPPQQQPASRHRAGHQAGLHPEDAPYITGNQRLHSGVPVASRARQTKAPTDDDNVLVDEEEIEADADIDGNGDVWSLQIPRSARYYPQPGQYTQGDTRVNVRRRQQQSVIPPRSSRQVYEEEEDQDFEEVETKRPSRTRPKMKLHWLVFAGIAILLMIAGWMAFSDLGTWWQNHQDDVTYGMPRTYQTDAVVGHNDSNSNPSHFIATPHLLRHTMLTFLAELGWQPELLQERAGHASFQQTYQTYVHPSPQALREAWEKIQSRASIAHHPEEKR